MRVLVCGGAGYIGSNMTALLAAEGHEPVLLASPRARPHVRSAIARSHPMVRVISYAELASQIEVRVVRELVFDAPSIPASSALAPPDDSVTAAVSH